MSSTGETTIHDALKPWKSLLVHTAKVGDAFSLFMRTTLTLCTFASISLVLYFVFSTQSRLSACPHCDRVRQPSALRWIARASSSAEAEASTNLSHVLFGIGGSAKTWDERRRYSELWWRPNVTRGFVWLDQEPSLSSGGGPSPAGSPPFRISANTSEFKYTCWYGSRSAIRIARIVKESFDLGLEGVRWFVMGDDDTVFFLENLVDVLARYDHSQMYYIGANSESVEQDVIHSYTMAYGGGGFAVSYPLAAELERVLDGCIDRYAGMYGSDQKVQGCLSEIGVPITKELGFHQLDIRGNPYGLLAAHPLAPLVSLHHLDYVDPIFPGLDQIDSLKKLRTAFESDPGRTLQHSFCYDLARNWSVSVSWGYTVQLYPSLMTAKELETAMQTFQTWRSWSSEPFTFNTRQLGQNPCERPVVYFLDQVHRVGDGQMLTTYVRRPSADEKDCDLPQYAPALAVQSFNVSSSTFRPNMWKKALRRQCCEVINGTDLTGRTVEVEIRGCKPMESVTPPDNIKIGFTGPS